jgi:hypothetical protein
MNGNSARRRRNGLLVVLTLLLGACAHSHRGEGGGDEGEVNAYPTDYKLEILAGMHAFLNDPTGIRDAAISQPALKPIGPSSLFNSPPTRYLVCVHFNPRKSATEYSGVKEVAAVFVSGRFDQFIETPKEQCADAVYTPFPELERMAR